MLYLDFNGSACHCETERLVRHVPYVHSELSLKVDLQDACLQVGTGQLFFHNVARQSWTLFFTTQSSLHSCFNASRLLESMQKFESLSFKRIELQCNCSCRQPSSD